MNDARARALVRQRRAAAYVAIREVGDEAGERDTRILAPMALKVATNLRVVARQCARRPHDALLKLREQRSARRRHGARRRIVDARERRVVRRSSRA